MPLQTSQEKACYRCDITKVPFTPRVVDKEARQGLECEQNGNHFWRYEPAGFSSAVVGYIGSGSNFPKDRPEFAYANFTFSSDLASHMPLDTLSALEKQMGIVRQWLRQAPVLPER